jgi:hypothetical protein
MAEEGTSNAPPPSPTPPASPTPAPRIQEAAQARPARQGPRPPLKHFKTRPPPKHLKLVLILSIVLGTFFLAGFALLILSLVSPDSHAVAWLFGPEAKEEVVEMGPLFTDQKNNVTLRPPLNWTINDPHDGWNLFIKSPVIEKGFSPLILFSVEVSPQRLDSYLKEHKQRIENDNKTVKWLSDEDPGPINGCPTRRLEFECQVPDDSGQIVKVHTLQYVIEDWPRFYRITGDVVADKFQRHLSRFEACAKSFTRLLPKPEASLPRGAFQKNPGSQP